MKKLSGSELKGTTKLTARQEQAIQALLTGVNVKEAAQHVQIGRTTLYRWLNDPVFRNAYHVAQERSQAWIMNRLQHLAAKALHVLEKILDDSEVPVLAKVEAARAILDFAVLGKEHSSQRSTPAPAKSDLSLSPLYLEPTLYEGKATAVLEQATQQKPSVPPFHGS